MTTATPLSDLATKKRPPLRKHLTLPAEAYTLLRHLSDKENLSMSKTVELLIIERALELDMKTYKVFV